MGREREEEGKRRGNERGNGGKGRGQPPK